MNDPIASAREPISIFGAVLIGAFLWVLFGTWAMASPLMSIPDEPAHTIKAASIWQGQLRGRQITVEGTAGMNGGGHVNTDQVEVPDAYAQAGGLPGCYAFHADFPATCAPDLPDSSRVVEATTTAGTYPPLFYALVGWPSRLIANDAGAYLMRVISAGICAAVIALAVRSLTRVVPISLAILGATIALTPMVPFLAGSVNPAGFEIAGAMLWWAALLAFAVTFGRGERLSRGLVAELVIGFAVLSLTRGLGLLFAGLAGVVVVGFVGWRQVREVVRDRRSWALGGVFAGIAVVAGVWVLANGQFDQVPGGRLPPDRRPLVELFSSLDRFFREMIAIFGWRDTGPVTPTVFVWTVALLLVVGAALMVGPGRQRVTLVVSSLSVVLLPAALQIRSLDRDGIAWQGRYVLPFAVGIPMLAVISLAPRLREFRSGIRSLGLIALVLWAFAQSYGMYAWFHRTVVGGDSQHLNPFDWIGWRPPLPVGFLLILGTLTALVPSVVFWLGLSDKRSGVDEERSDSANARSAGDRGVAGESHPDLVAERVGRAAVPLAPG